MDHGVEKKEPHAVEQTAKRYQQEYDWVDEAAIEISLMIFSDASAQSAALSRLFSQLGFARTSGRYTALRLLHFAQGRRLSQNQMRAEMGVTSPAITYLIDGMERDGLVLRQPYPNDRRVVYVELTEEGQTICEKLVPGMAHFMAKMTEGFSEGDKHAFRSYLKRFYENASSSYLDDGPT